MPSGQEPCPAETLAEVREGGADTVDAAVSIILSLTSSYRSAAFSEDFTLLAHFKALS